MKVFTFPILQGARFTIKKKRIVHLESNCCRGHSEKCDCSFCDLHKPYMESAATKLYNHNIDMQEQLEKCDCIDCMKILKDLR